MSHMTLIRLIHALPDPVSAAAPRVLGVDEFAPALRAYLHDRAGRR
jgi:hypothetical protein